MGTENQLLSRLLGLSLSVTNNLFLKIQLYQFERMLVE